MVTMTNRFFKYSIPILLSINLACGSKPTKPDEPEPQEEITTVNVDNDIGARIETRNFIVNIPANSLEDDAEVEIRSSDENISIASNVTNKTALLGLRTTASIEDSLYLEFKPKNERFSNSDLVISRSEGRFQIHDFTIDSTLVIPYMPNNEQRKNLSNVDFWVNNVNEPSPTLEIYGDPSSGARYALILHGLGSNSRTFNDPNDPQPTLFNFLFNKYHGNIASFTYPTSDLPENNARALEDLLNNNQLDNIDSYGHSMGGVVGRLAIRMNPERYNDFYQFGAPNNGVYSIDLINNVVEYLINNENPENLQIFNPYTSLGAQSLVRGSDLFSRLNTPLITTRFVRYYIILGNYNGIFSALIPGDDYNLVGDDSSNPLHNNFPEFERTLSTITNIYNGVNHWQLIENRNNIFNDINAHIESTDGFLVNSWNFGFNFNGIAFRENLVELLAYNGILFSDVDLNGELPPHRPIQVFNHHRALSYDGQNLWVAACGSRGLDYLVKLNHETLLTVDSGIAPDSEDISNGRCTQIKGIAFKDNELWCVSDHTDRLYKLNKNDFSEIGRLDLDINFVGPLALSPNYAYVMDDHNEPQKDKIIRLDMNNGRHIKEFDSQSSTIGGMTYQNGYLYLCDISLGLVYQISINE